MKTKREGRPESGGLGCRKLRSPTEVMLEVGMVVLIETSSSMLMASFAATFVLRTVPLINLFVARQNLVM